MNADFISDLTNKVAYSKKDYKWAVLAWNTRHPSSGELFCYFSYLGNLNLFNIVHIFFMPKSEIKNNKTRTLLFYPDTNNHYTNKQNLWKRMIS